MNSRAKGKRGELEAVAALRAIGFEVRRGQQYNGADGSPDVIVNAPLHPEVKRRKRIAAFDYLRQAIAGADSQLKRCAPVVLMREDGDVDWAVMFRLEDWGWIAAAYATATGRPVYPAERDSDERA